MKKNVLYISAGQTYIKFKLVQNAENQPVNFLRGRVGNIGMKCYFAWRHHKTHGCMPIHADSHREAIFFIMDWHRFSWPLGNLLDKLNSVVFHFKETFFSDTPILLSDEILSAQASKNRFAKSEDFPMLAIIAAWNEEFADQITRYVASKSHSVNAGSRH